MNKHDFEQDYINSINSTAPDMELLWSRIAEADEADDNIAPFISASEECHSKPLRPVFRTVMSAVAMTAAVVCLTFALNNDSMISNESMAASDESEVMDLAAENNVQQETIEYVYSDYCSQADNYELLNLADTPSGLYNVMAAAPEEEEFFVEAQVLSDTEYFADVEIQSSKMLADGVREYSVKVLHIFSETSVDIPDSFKVYSASPYLLRNNREYLLPIETDDNNMPFVVFENAPQIEITLDRELIFHNGWSSLSENSTCISYPQVYSDDYFYDRMNITAEASIENLIDTWEKLRI